MWRQILTNGLLIIGLVFVGGCKGDNRSNDVSLTSIPERPLVLSGDIVIDTASQEDVTIAAPWTSFQFAMTNDSDKPLVIRVLEVQFSVPGSISTTTVAFTADEWYDPATDYFLYLDPGETETAPAVFYAGSLPENDSFRYQMKIIPQGWFASDCSGTCSTEEEKAADALLNPIERLEATITTSTE